VKAFAGPRVHTSVALAVGVLALAAGCYRVAGKPYENVSTVGVKVFVNKTLYRDVDFELTDALRRELSASTYYTVETPRNADAVLEGELTDYRELAEVVDENQVVTARRIVAAARYSLTDNHTGEVLAGPKTAKWSELYRTRTGLPLDEVRQETFRKLARKIVTQVFMPWPENDGQASSKQE